MRLPSVGGSYYPASHQVARHVVQSPTLLPTNARSQPVTVHDHDQTPASR